MIIFHLLMFCFDVIKEVNKNNDILINFMFFNFIILIFIINCFCFILLYHMMGH